MNLLLETQNSDIINTEEKDTDIRVKKRVKENYNIDESHLDVRFLVRIVNAENFQIYDFSKSTIINIPLNDHDFNFKNSFTKKNYIQLSFEEKIFILTGKNSNQFFFLDTDKNNVIKLAETLSSHLLGNLIYVPLNNCIYCIGGVNTKKCEIYKNDELFLSKLNINLNHNSHSESNKLNKNNYWQMIAEMSCFRSDFSSIIINQFIYVFFGFNNATKINNNSIERLNVLKNDIWESMNLNQNISFGITLNSHGILPLNEKEILLVGGNDGKNNKDAIFVYNSSNNSLKLFKEKIPYFKRFMQTSFTTESQFTKICSNDSNYANIDNLNNLHLVNTKRFDYQVIDLNQK